MPAAGPVERVPPPGSGSGMNPYARIPGMADRGGSKDYTRICKRCSTARLLPKEYAKDKGPSARQVAGMQRAPKYAIGHQREKYSM
jgi:hypothetical protein